MHVIFEIDAMKADLLLPYLYSLQYTLDIPRSSMKATYGPFSNSGLMHDYLCPTQYHVILDRDIYIYIYRDIYICVYWPVFVCFHCRRSIAMVMNFILENKIHVYIRKELL